MNIAAINLNLLAVLDALLQERNVTRAARRIGLSQPRVSHALAELRSLFADPLLVRSSHGMVPTERALALAGPLQTALKHLQAAIAPPTRFDPAQIEGRVVIAASDFAGFVLLPRLLARLRTEAPKLNIAIQAWSQHSIPPSLESGEADVMVGFARQLPAAHRRQALFEDRFVCVARAGHPALVRGRLSLKHYLRLGHVLVSSQIDGPGVVDQVLAARGLTRTVALRVPHFLLVPPLLAATDLVAALSQHVALPMAATLPLQVFSPPLPLPTSTVYQVWHERTHASPLGIWLRKRIAEAASAPQPVLSPRADRKLSSI